MATFSSSETKELAQAFAFLGNSLLTPMNQTEHMGVESSFWAGFPSFGSEDVQGAIDRCASYAAHAESLGASGGNPVQEASVEYTRLFVGPPKPLAPPWETFYRNEGVTSGFGQATFEMQALLREMGLAVSNENNQYADHIGIELLCLSVLCERAADGDDQAMQQANSLACERLLAWAPKLESAVEALESNGYIANLLALACRLLHLFEQPPSQNLA